MEEGAAVTVASSDTNTDNKCVDKKREQRYKFGRAFIHVLLTRHFMEYHSLPWPSRFNVKVILWIVFLLAATILMLCSLGAITSRFAARRTYLTSSYHFPKQMKFPAITFCIINPLKYSAVLSNNLSLEQADLFLAYLIDARVLTCFILC